MNPYVLVGLLVASALLPVVLAWAAGYTYALAKVILWILWVLVISTAIALWEYAIQTDHVNTLGVWFVCFAVIANFLSCIFAMGTPFRVRAVSAPIGEVKQATPLEKKPAPEAK